MKYQVINKETRKLEAVFYEKEDAVDCVDFEHSFETHTIVRVIECQTCGKDESEERFDYYGHSTGYHCDDCYNDSSKYKYRKDAYQENY